MASGEDGAHGHPPAGKRERGSAHRRAQPCPRAAEEGKSAADGPERTEAAGPPVSGRRKGPRPTRSGAGRVRTQEGARLDAGTVPGRASPGSAGLEPAALYALPRRVASHQERHGCAQNRLLMKSLKSEARVVPWRRRGGCSPAPAAAPPRFRLLFRQPVGSSPIGQFKPPLEPLGFRHLGPAPSVTEMPRPTGNAPPTSGSRGRCTAPSSGIHTTPPAPASLVLPHRSGHRVPSAILPWSSRLLSPNALPSKHNRKMDAEGV